MTMGDRIKELRIKNGMSQEELGELISVQKSAIRKYEKGSVENIKRSAIKKMADRFGVSPCYLMWGEENDEDEQLHDVYTPDIEELIQLFSTLPKDSQDHFLGLLRDLSKARAENVNHRRSDS